MGFDDYFLLDVCYPFNGLVFERRFKRGDPGTDPKKLSRRKYTEKIVNTSRATVTIRHRQTTEPPEINVLSTVYCEQDNTHAGTN